MDILWPCANTKLQLSEKKKHPTMMCNLHNKTFCFALGAKAFKMIHPDSYNTFWGTPRRDNLDSLKPLSWSTGLSPLREKDPLSLIVCVDACRDKSMSVTVNSRRWEKCKRCERRPTTPGFALTMPCLSSSASAQQSNGLPVWPWFLQMSFKRCFASCCGLILEKLLELTLLPK